MIYKRAKIYNDGSHYIAIPSENFSHNKGGTHKTKDKQTFGAESKDRQRTNAIKRRVRLMRNLSNKLFINGKSIFPVNSSSTNILWWSYASNVPFK